MSDPAETLEAKLDRLRAFMRDCGRVVIAYSGGVDSSVVLKVGVDILGADALGVLAISASLPRSEREAAITLSEEMGAELHFLETKELSEPAYLANAPNRCFHCKDHVYAAIRAFADQRNIPHVLDGMNVNDTLDVRPGRAAATKHGVRSPLHELGFSKDDVRAAGRLLGLPNADKPAAACLSSRIPYGTPVTADLLARIESAEAYLGSLGFDALRVRHHGDVARIEVPPDRMTEVLGCRDQIIGGLKALGWLYVTLDLAALREGSMNEVLAARSGNAGSLSA